MKVGGLLTEFGSISPDDAEEVAGSTAVVDIMDSILGGWVFWEVTAQPDTDPKLVQFLSRTYAQATSGKFKLSAAQIIFLPALKHEGLMHKLISLLVTALSR